MAEADLTDVHHALRSLEGLGCRVIRNDNGQRADLDEVMWLVVNTLASVARARASATRLRVTEIGAPTPTLVMGEEAHHWLRRAEQTTKFMFDAQLPRPKWATTRAEDAASGRWDF